MLYRKIDNAAVPWDGGLINDVRYPRTIESLWSDAQLATIGLYRAKPGAATPAGQRIKTSEVKVVSGIVRWVHEFEDIPPDHPSGFPLSMRQLRLGLVAAGMPGNFIRGVIEQMPEGTDRDVALIWYEESSTVEWGHPMTQALISTAGISQEQAEAMWLAAKDLEA